MYYMSITLALSDSSSFSQCFFATIVAVLAVLISSTANTTTYDPSVNFKRAIMASTKQRLRFHFVQTGPNSALIRAIIEADPE